MSVETAPGRHGDHTQMHRLATRETLRRSLDLTRGTGTKVGRPAPTSIWNGNEQCVQGRCRSTLAAGGIGTAGTDQGVRSLGRAFPTRKAAGEGPLNKCNDTADTAALFRGVQQTRSNSSQAKRSGQRQPDAAAVVVECTQRSSMDPILQRCIAAESLEEAEKFYTNMARAASSFFGAASAVKFVAAANMIVTASDANTGVNILPEGAPTKAILALAAGLVERGDRESLDQVESLLVGQLGPNVLHLISKAGLGLATINSARRKSTYKANDEQTITAEGNIMESTRRVVDILQVDAVNGKHTLEKFVMLMLCKSKQCEVSTGRRDVGAVDPVADLLNDITFLSYFESQGKKSEVITSEYDIYKEYLYVFGQKKADSRIKTLGTADEGATVYDFIDSGSLLRIPEKIVNNEQIVNILKSNPDVITLSSVKNLLDEWFAHLASGTIRSDGTQGNSNISGSILDYVRSFAGLVGEFKDTLTTKTHGYTLDELIIRTTLDGIFGTSLMGMYKQILEATPQNETSLTIQDKIDTVSLLQDTITLYASQFKTKTNVLDEYVVSVLDSAFEMEIMTLADAWYWLNSSNCKNIILTKSILISLIRGCRFVQGPDGILQLTTLFGEAQGRNIELDREIYTELFKATRGTPKNSNRDRDTHSVLETWENNMISQGIEHNEDSIKAYILALLSCNYVPQAALRIQDMRIQGIPRGNDFYEEIFEVCTKAHASAAWAVAEYDFIWNIMNEYRPTMKDVKNLIRCCTLIKDAPSALKLMELAESQFEVRTVSLHGGEESQVVVEEELYDLVIQTLKTRDPLTMLDIEKIREKKQAFPIDSSSNN